MNLQTFVEDQFKQAFAQVFPQLDLNDTPIEIKRSTQETFGHYQCNSAMKLTKVLQMPPRDIASKIVDQINAAKIAAIAKCELAGPGFINLSIAPEFLSDFCQKMRLAPKLGVIAHHPLRIVIDFPSPNTAKEMHVGHLRSSIIGDCLARLFEFLGNDVLRLNHVGDWGTSFGMLIAYLKQYHSGVLTGETPANLTFLVACYKAAKKLFDEDELFKTQSQGEVVQLQGGDADALKAWHLICNISNQAHQEIYDLLDLKVINRGESFYNPYLKGIVTDLESKHLLQISDGAQCLFMEGFVNREGEPLPLLIQKRDGGFNYATTDLAAISHRIQVEKADRILYVVDAGQAMHFAMIFAAATLAGYLDPNKVNAEHVPFGLVLGPDGKKFKTRSGDSERLIDLLTTAMAKAEEILLARNQQSESNMTTEQVKAIAKVLGINAVKYADLSGNRQHDYAFSYEKMLRFEGNTAAFLMYAYVRIQGIKRRVGSTAQATHIALNHPSEIVLGLHLCQFAEVLESIGQDLLPNHLCDYLFGLAEKFNAFFRDCRVEGVPEQSSRLALCDLTAHVLKEGLHILGLQTVNMM